MIICESTLYHKLLTTEVDNSINVNIFQNLFNNEKLMYEADNYNSEHNIHINSGDAYSILAIID